MARLPAFACIILSACLISTACTSHPELKPTGTVPITLAGEKKSSTANAYLQNVVVITLPRADPGCTWQISFHDPRFLKQLSALKAPPGGETGPTVSFMTLHNGRTTLRFLLLPPNAGRDAAPVDQQELLLTIE